MTPLTIEMPHAAPKPTRIRTSGTHRRVTYAEERQPCGAPGLSAIYLRHPHEPLHWPSLSDCLVSRPKPFALVIWEPLRTKAPAPSKASPHCCYINTVIFYHRPYITWPAAKPWKAAGRWKMIRAGFLEWDKTETRLSWDDQVEFDGEVFEIGGGNVVWARKRWWMCHGARRKRVAT